MINPDLIIGIIGMSCIMLAYFMNSSKRWQILTTKYDTTNFMGATLLTIYSYQIKAWPFLILNLVWMSIAIFDLTKDMRGKNETKKIHKTK